MKKIKVALIGLGRQTLENHLPAVQEARNVILDCVCDSDKRLAYKFGAELNVPAFDSIEVLLASRKPDFAIVCVSHGSYLPLIESLAARGVHVLKEKPFATSLAESVALHKIAQEAKILLKITLVRRYHPIYRSFPQLSKRIGNIHTIEGRYTLNVARLDEGWRSKKVDAGGGAALDMGYHAVDLLVWFFGLPNRVGASIGRYGRDNQRYDVEDTAVALFAYDETDERTPIMGSLLISRAFPEKDERLLIVGSRGAIVIKRGEITRLDQSGAVVESLSRVGTWLSASIDEIEDFADSIIRKEKITRPLYFEHFAHMAFIESLYRSAAIGEYVVPKSLLPEFVTSMEGSV